MIRAESVAMSRLLLVVLFAVLGGVAHADSFDDLVACGEREREPAERLTFCTRFLEAPDQIPYRRAMAMEFRGRAYLDLDDDLAAAERDLTECLNLQVGLEMKAFCHGTRGDVRMRAGDFSGALADYDAWIPAWAQMSPDSGSAIYQRGMAYQALGETEKAIADFGEALRRDRRAVYYDARGRAYSHRAKGDDVERAVADFRTVIYLLRGTPNSPEALAAKQALRDLGVKP